MVLYLLFVFPVNLIGYYFIDNTFTYEHCNQFLLYRKCPGFDFKKMVTSADKPLCNHKKTTMKKKLRNRCSPDATHRVHSRYIQSDRKNTHPFLTELHSFWDTPHMKENTKGTLDFLARLMMLFSPLRVQCSIFFSDYLTSISHHFFDQVFAK